MNRSDVYTSPVNIVASWYRSSTGTALMPSLTSSAGRTPDSRSRINQPSARTVSLTQNGIRQTTKSSELARPRATLVITHAIGKATRSVNAVDITDIVAVRTNTCQYKGSVKNVRYCSKLARYSCGAIRSRNDSSASSSCGRTMSANSHRSAGASSSVNSSRRCRAPCTGASTMGARRGGRVGEADRALGVEAEEHPFADLEVRQSPGLRQSHSKLEAGVLLGE